MSPTTLAQVFLTVALPAAGVMLAWTCHRSLQQRWSRQVLATLWIGTLAGVALGVQSFMTAQLDGRTIWSAYPFALTLGAMALEDVRSLRLPMSAARLGDAFTEDGSVEA